MDTIYNIFKQILNMSMTAGIIICVILGIRLLLYKAPKIFRYLLWSVVLFRLLCPAAVSSPFSALRLWNAPVTEFGRVEYIPDSAPERNFTPTPRTNTSIQNRPLTENKNALSNPSAPVRQTNYKNTAVFLGSILWLAGFLMMAGYGILSAFCLKRRLTDSIHVKDNIFISNHIDTPFAMGIVNPKIYLPQGLSEEETHFIILHEQTHIRRGDVPVKILAFFALSIHWFNPLVWIAFFTAEKDMEMACDETVMKKMDADIRADYSRSLLFLASGKRIVRGTPLAFGEGNTKSRVKNVMQYKKPALFIICIAAVLVIGCLLGFGTNPGSDKKTDKTTNDIQTDTETATQKPKSPNEAAIQWAEAFCKRDGETISAMSSAKAKETLKEAALLDEENGTWTFGFSSPWPEFTETDYRILNISEEKTEILYYARTSEPHVSVWKEALTWAQEKDSWIVEEETLTPFDSIRSPAEFQSAYPDGIINTPMDYLADGTASILHQNAILSSTWIYRTLSNPKTAAVYLLNLAEDTAETSVESETGDGSALVTITFSDDPSHSITVKMVPSSAANEISSGNANSTDGIWIPQDYRIIWNSNPQNYLYSSYDLLGEYGAEQLSYAHYTALYTEQTVYSTTADITHDGILDRIDLTIAAESTQDPASSLTDILYGVGLAYLKVYPGTADNQFEEKPCFISKEITHAHVGNGQLSLVKKDGKDYLMSSNMYAIMGSASYNYVVYYIDTEQKNAVCVDEKSIGFAVDENYMGQETEKREDVIPDFKKQLEQWTDDSVLFVSCDVSSDPEILVSEPGTEYTASDYFDKVWER